jgi:hypothetical protein
MELSFRKTMLVKLIVIAWAALVQAGSTPANAVTPRDFGGKGDVVMLRDGSIRQAMTDFRSSSAGFTSADIGKAVVVYGAGPDGAALVTKIQSFVSPKQVALEASANTAVTGALTYYGTDDTAALRKCVYEGTAKGGECTISDGVTFMVSNTTANIGPFGAGSNPIDKGTINGQGRIIFAPQGKVTGGKNDRLFYISSPETRPAHIAGAIARGATSFRAEDPSDAAILSPGNWVLITERDPLVKDHVYADWMEVSAVDGSVVKTARPFRMAFPNARAWGGAPSYWGLSFRKVGPITSNITIQGMTIIIPKISDARVVGIATRDTRGTVISHLSCQDGSGNCFAGYMDQGLVFEDNNIGETVYAEFAAEVDSAIVRNRVNESGSDVSLPGPPTSGGLEVDFATGFSRIERNIIGPSRQVCILVSTGIHDTVVSGNTCGLVTFGTGGNCIFARGAYRLTVTENICQGGSGPGTGIAVSDGTGLAAPIYNEGNRIFNNRVQGFATAYACGVTRLKSDSCDRQK